MANITKAYGGKVMYNLFPVPCYAKTLGEDEQKVVQGLLDEHFLKLKILHSDEIDFSKSGSTHNCEENHILDENLIPVKNIFDQHIKNYISSCNNGIEINYWYSNSWFTFTTTNNFCPAHFHPGKSSDITGIYYPKFLSEFGNLQIFNPNLIQPVNLAAFNFLHTIECKTGLLILFPASLLHQCEVNKSQEIRISFVFDIFLDVNNRSTYM